MSRSIDDKQLASTTWFDGQTSEAISSRPENCLHVSLSMIFWTSGSLSASDLYKILFWNRRQGLDKAEREDDWDEHTKSGVVVDAILRFKIVGFVKERRWSGRGWDERKRRKASIETLFTRSDVVWLSIFRPFASHPFGRRATGPLTELLENTCISPVRWLFLSIFNSTLSSREKTLPHCLNTPTEVSSNRLKARQLSIVLIRVYKSLATCICFPAGGTRSSIVHWSLLIDRSGSKWQYE